MFHNENNFYYLKLYKFTYQKFIPMRPIVLLFIIYSSFSFGQQDTVIPFTITNKSVGKDITESFSYILTNNKNFTVNKIIKNQNQLKKHYCGCEEKDVENLPKDIWLIGKIKNETKDTLNLVFYTSNSQEVTTYIISENDTIKKTVGYIQVSDNMFSKEVVNAINFKIKPDEEKTIILYQEVYLKFEMIYKFNLFTLDLYNEEKLKDYRYYQGNRFFLGILSGSLLILFFNNILMFYRVRDSIYINYSLYILSTFIFMLLVIDRNRNSYIGPIMLHFELIKEVSYTFSILFYGLLVKTLIKTNNINLIRGMKFYFSLICIYLLYLIIIYYKNPFTFDEFTLKVIFFFKYLSLVFTLILVFQLHKKRKIKHIKYIFYGSLILITSYILQELLHFLDSQYLSRNFSKFFVRTNASILIGTLIEISFFSFALYLKSLEVLKAKILLENLSSIKSRFFANISHEFRTPLTLIKSPVQSLQALIKDENQQNQLKLIDNNSNRMLELVDQLLELSKIDSGNLKLLFKEGNITTFLTYIIEPFTFQSKENGIIFTSTIQKITENSVFDKDAIEKIVTNLVSNAFKYTSQKEAITVTASVENFNLRLIVSNTGSHLKKEDLPKLFERFYQEKVSNQGVGIGLALVKELVDLYKGKITTSLENKTLSFTVDLPLEKLNENAIIIPVKGITPTIENIEINDNEVPILLIVDDNAAIRSVLKDIFKNEYQILEAQDGEEALKVAQSAIPTCIISDVMMPKMDGFEFSKQIKNNEVTSFIPVILLTAKTANETHLQALKSTADAYLTKPFNNEIVKATVAQLIAERKKLQLRYSQELVLRPVDIVINSVEEKFIGKLQVVLDKNLSNADYSSEDFANEIGMSRMQLHRKLKSLLGVTATEFLRNERLKVGVELLKKGNGNISDVAYAVGFNDVSYFSKCFKEMYNCTPKEYVEKNK